MVIRCTACHEQYVGRCALWTTCLDLISDMRQETEKTVTSSHMSKHMMMSRDVIRGCLSFGHLLVERLGQS